MTNPPLEYLVTSSQAGLENFELARLNKIANLRKELREIVEEWIEAETQSRLARWILQCRRTQEAASNSHDAESSPPLPVENIAENLLPPSARTQNDRETQLAASALSKRSARYRRDLYPAPLALPLLRPQLSARAVDTLNFLEHHVRLQTDAIFSGICDAATEAARNDELPDSAKSAERHLRLHESSRTAPFFSVSLARSEVPRSARGRNPHVDADRSAQSAPSNARAPAPSSPEAGQVVPLLPKGKVRPAAPIRVSLRCAQPQRRAV